MELEAIFYLLQKDAVRSAVDLSVVSICSPSICHDRLVLPVVAPWLFNCMFLELDLSRSDLRCRKYSEHAVASSASCGNYLWALCPSLLHNSFGSIRLHNIPIRCASSVRVRVGERLRVLLSRHHAVNLLGSATYAESKKSADIVRSVMPSALSFFEPDAEFSFPQLTPYRTLRYLVAPIWISLLGPTQ